MKSHNRKRVFVVALKGIMLSVKMALSRFVNRIRACFLAMTLSEKIFSIGLFIVALCLLGMKIHTYYKEQTKLISDYGGTYKEATVGELKYINPVLANSDVDTSISRLIFSSMITIDKDGSVIPGVAKSWEISENKLQYTFSLRDDVYFHDGIKMTAEDVVYTLDQIRDPNFQSPLYDAWKDVEVESKGENIVIFTLPKVYGPFIYNCDFGILPSHVSPDEQSKKFIGSGPYKYVNIKKTGQKADYIELTAFDKYFMGKPYITNLEVDFFAKTDDAIKSFSTGKDNSLSGATYSNGSGKDISFETSKQLAIIPNLRLDKYLDKEFRSKILSDYSFPEKVKVALTTLDSPQQRGKAEELKKEFSKRNIELELRFMNAIQMRQVLDEKKYELLLYGFDFSHDPDPYVFWHTSQLEKLNFSGYSDKKSDKLLEDARMTTDNKARSEKYDQFNQIIKDESLAKFFDPIKYNYYLGDIIHGDININTSEISFRYSNLPKLYIKEKRVKK